jgi:hypothetical protein
MPEQTGFEEATIDTVTTELLLITMNNWLLEAGLLDIQVVIDDVRMQDTRSPDAGL